MNLNLPFPYVVNHIPRNSNPQPHPRTGIIRPTKRIGKALKPSRITIHSTANPKSTARNERVWLLNPTNKRMADWNICIDEKEAIEAIPLNEVANHAQKGSYISIGIEICESGDRKKTLRNASILVAYLLHEFGWDTSVIDQHNKYATWKNCPRILRENPRQWPEFISMIQAELNLLKGVKPVTAITTPKQVDHTPSNWAKASWEKACKKIGKDGKPIFDGTNPKEPLTREQAAAVLDRLGLLD